MVTICATDAEDPGSNPALGKHGHGHVTTIRHWHDPVDISESRPSPDAEAQNLSYRGPRSSVLTTCADRQKADMPLLSAQFCSSCLAGPEPVTDSGWGDRPGVTVTQAQGPGLHGSMARFQVIPRRNSGARPRADTEFTAYRPSYQQSHIHGFQH